MTDIRLVNTTNDDMIDYLQGSGIVPDLIEADFAWPYRQTGGGDRKKFRSTAKRIYGAQDWNDIRTTLELAAGASRPDGVLLLWTTTPLKLDIAERVVLPLKASGHWHYATTWYWHKLGSPGLGQWIRGDVEELWILSRRSNGDQGRIPPRLKEQMVKRCDRNWYDDQVLDPTPDQVLLVAQSYGYQGETYEGAVPYLVGMMESDPVTFECARRELVHSEKPAAMLEQVISRYSLADELVLSLCAGRFPTGLAAQAVGRNAIGAESNPDRYRETCLAHGWEP